jgi:hypothetical protein
MRSPTAYEEAVTKLAPSDELERLQALSDAQRRGYEFQDFIGILFRREHFRVELNPGTARPRQTDLLVTRGDEVYLIEAKWRTDKANIDDIDTLFTRLHATPPSVIGVMISYSSFTDEAIARVIELSNRHVLLVSGMEIEDLVRRSNSLIRLLRRKRDHLLVHREVLLADTSSKQRARLRARKGTLVAPDAEFVFPDGERMSCLTSTGSFGEFTFAHEIPDVDWVPGSGCGAAVDIAVPVHDEAGIITLLHKLSDLGWVTENARWSIQQTTVNWHGLGAPSFVRSLPDWRKRYKRVRDTHHSEEFCYFDFCEGGFYTLTSKLSAHRVRQARYSMLSFQLVGIPLDTLPIRDLCESFEVDQPIYFRPLMEKALTHVRGRDVDMALKPLAFVVQPDLLLGDPSDRDLVRGIVVENPYYKPGSPLSANPEWLPSLVSNSKLLICDLQSWHQLSGPERLYRLCGWDSVHTADAAVVRPIADW